MKTINTVLDGRYNDRQVIVAKATKDATRLNKDHNQTRSVVNNRFIYPGDPEYKIGDFVFFSSVVAMPRWMSEKELWWNGLSYFGAEATLKDYLAGPYVDTDKEYIDLSTIEIFSLKCPDYLW
jgi:hypothetical protein